MKIFISFLLLLLTGVKAHALVINEIMSNPVGDDSGREWVELYNDGTDPIDLTSLSVSIKGGTAVPITPLSGGVTLSPGTYAIIGSVVSGSTKFSQDYPNYSGPLLKSSISLVNTGATSIDIRLNGTVIASISSYTAAKEGATYSFISGSYVTGIPTPGTENQTQTTGSNGSNDQATTTQTAGGQVTIPQMSPPLADIIIYLPSERMAVAGAPATFSVYALTNAGNPIDHMTYTWAFGDGGSKTGSTTVYRYLYPGRYIAQVEGTNSLIAGTARMIVKVVAPDISISDIQMGKYGPYITLMNPNPYDLDISDWKIVIDNVPYSFPRNTLLGVGETKFPGTAMGFASTTISTSTIIKLLFPNMDEVLRVTQKNDVNKIVVQATSTQTIVRQVSASPQRQSQVKVTKISQATSSALTLQKKDTRIATFILSLFR